MEERSLARGDVAVDGGADERVHESQRRFGADDLGPDQLVEHPRCLLVLDAAERCRRPEVGAFAEDGERTRDGRASPPSRASRTSTERDAARGPSSSISAAFLASEATPSAASTLSSSSRSSGFPPRRGMAGGDEAGVSGLAEARADELGHRPLGQRARLERHGDRLGRQLAQERGVDTGLRRAQAAGDEHRQALEAARKVGEESQRGVVAPVQVVDRKDERPLGARVDGQPVQAVEHGERGVAAVGAAGRVRGPEHGLRRRRGSAQQLAVGLRHGDQRLEELTHDSERELPLELAASGGEHTEPGFRAQPAGLRDQPRLADPRRPFDDAQPAGAARSALNEGFQRLELTVPLEQPRALRAGR